MRPLATIERFLERVFERQTARLFHARLQPVQLLRRVERAMERDRHGVGDRTVVPDHFDIRLHPDDLAEFGDRLEALATELADGALAFARAHRYTLPGRPRVEIRSDASVEAGDVVIETGVEGEHESSASPHDPADLSHTAVFAVPLVDAPVARLRELRPDGSVKVVDVDGRPLTIGRADDNRLVLDDGLVSRHHARVQARRGALVFTDLESTNGSRVNGVRVAEVVLGEGDRIEIGGSVLIVEPSTPV